ncbi:MAG: RES domain-containing protein [Mesorhizobium sp.]|nr:MAG: RES domain-containing protein [Mesorhizobium sp.]
MAARVAQAFERHYQRTPRDPDGYEYAMLRDPEIDYTWYRDGEPTADAITSAADISVDAARDLQQILDDEYGDYHSMEVGEETEFADDAHYEEIMPGDREWRESWWEFERSIRSEARFFSRTAAQKLGALFDDIDRMRTRGGAPLIVSAGPETNLTLFFRARVFQSDSKLVSALERPDLHLAAPPNSLAAAGRMNAKGISTFYGATDPSIALAEVRPPVGSQVAVAKFEIIRPLKLLDLNALKDVHERGSIFDPDYADRLSRMMFLRSLCDRMARAVMPDDQDFEYLPTQATADFLATEGKVPLDGILFPSPQAGSAGLNAVLFHKASKCEALPLPKGTKIEASTAQQYAEGWEREYTVWETVPKQEPEKPKVKPQGLSFFHMKTADWEENRDGDSRLPTLRIDPNSVQVHVVNAINIDSSPHQVTRYRHEDRGTERDDF